MTVVLSERDGPGCSPFSKGKRAGGQGPAGQQPMGREGTAGGQGAVVAVAAAGAMAAVATARLNWGKE